MINKILVVKNRALGDSIIGLSSLSYIKTIFSNAKISYALPPWIVPLYADAVSPADEVIPLDLASASGWPTLFMKLRKEKFDLIVELHQSGRTGKFFKIYSLLSRTPYLFHNHHRTPADAPSFFGGPNVPAIQRDLDGLWYNLKGRLQMKGLVRPHFLDFPPTLRPRKDSPKEKQIVLGVVGTRRTKLWPLPYFKRLCELILAHDEAYSFIIPLSDSAQDEELGREITRLGFPQRARMVKGPLSGLPALLDRSGLYIGNDTGLKHLSVSLGLRTLTFFGPEDPAEWHPYDRERHPYFFVEKLECRTRLSHFCPLNECDSMICLNQTFPEEVFKSLLEGHLI